MLADGAIIQRITGGPYGPDEVGFPRFIQRLAEAADMNVHRAYLHMDVGAPQTFQQGFPGEDLAGMVDEGSSRRYSVGPRAMGRPARVT